MWFHRPFRAMIGCSMPRTVPRLRRARFNRGAIYRRDGALVRRCTGRTYSPPLKRVRYVAPSLFVWGAMRPPGRDGVLVASVAQEGLIRPPLKRVRCVRAFSICLGRMRAPGRDGVLVASVAQEGLIRPPLKRVRCVAPSLFVWGACAPRGATEYLWRLLPQEGLIRPR